MKKTRFLTILLSILIIGTFSLKSQTYKKVKPQKGDGIYSLLNRHGLTPKKYYRTFLELNKDILGNSKQLSLHKRYRLPNKNDSKSKGKKHVALFGKKHATYKLVDSKLKNAVYYIVAGHGGPDPGAIGKRNGYQLCEDEYAYDIALRLTRQLLSHGATVYMIVRDNNDGIRDKKYLKPDKDEKVWRNKRIPLSAVKKLRQRTNAINKLYKKHRGKYQRLLVLHIDSRSKGKRIDIYGYHHSKSRTGKKFTKNLINTLEKRYKKAQPNRGFKGIYKSRNELYMIRKPYPATCFLELGNIQNTEDQVRFIESNNRQAIANWLTEGCIKDYK